MRCIVARFVPKDLTFFQKYYRKMFTEDLISKVKNDPTFMKRIITGDKTWVHKYDVETSQQSSEWRFENNAKVTQDFVEGFLPDFKVQYILNAYHRA